MVFSTGKHHHELAEKGIEALEKWLLLEDFPQQVIENLFSKLFPMWKSYFVSAGKIIYSNKQIIASVFY